MLRIVVKLRCYFIPLWWIVLQRLKPHFSPAMNGSTLKETGLMPSLIPRLSPSTLFITHDYIMRNVHLNIGEGELGQF